MKTFAIWIVEFIQMTQALNTNIRFQFRTCDFISDTYVRFITTCSNVSESSKTQAQTLWDEILKFFRSLSCSLIACRNYKYLLWILWIQQSSWLWWRNEIVQIDRQFSSILKQRLTQSFSSILKQRLTQSSDLKTQVKWSRSHQLEKSCLNSQCTSHHETLSQMWCLRVLTVECLSMLARRIYHDTFCILKLSLRNVWRSSDWQIFSWQVSWRERTQYYDFELTLLELTTWWKWWSTVSLETQ